MSAKFEYAVLTIMSIIGFLSKHDLLFSISFAYKKLFIAFSLACFALASFLFRYVAPRALLEDLQVMEAAAMSVINKQGA